MSESVIVVLACICGIIAFIGAVLIVCALTDEIGEGGGLFGIVVLIVSVLSLIFLLTTFDYKCSNCGHEGLGGTYCTNCGANILEHDANHCHNCGEYITSDYKYCPKCGAVINADKEE